MTERDFNIEEIEAEIERDTRRVKTLAYGIILLLFFLICSTCCDPNEDLPPKPTAPRGSV